MKSKSSKRNIEIAVKVLNIQEEIPVKRKNKRKQVKKEKYYSFDEILVQNAQLLESIEWARTAAKSELSVLIYGETGTGKEMYAQSIHTNSNRSKAPFLAMNCAAIPENLFGTTKGIYTVAIDRVGLSIFLCSCF